MAKRSVNVLIRARDEASKKFGVVAMSAGIMGKALKSVANITKTAFVTAFRIAKKAVIGLAAAFAYSTYAAIKQEAAEIELASALRMTGEYSEEVMHKLKAQATAIQDVSVYGDEYILTLMRMAMTLGVTKDKLGEAAKAAIALHAGFGGGRGKPEIFLRYYIDALRGTGTSLASYVGELRKAKTEEEKQVILQRALARGWDVVKSKADSTGGALKQLKNKLGDIAETIAWPFLPGITSAAKAMKNWAIENEADIAYWAKKVHSTIVFVKDVFFDFVDFMKKDWQAGMSFVFDSFLKLLTATFTAAVTLAIAGGKGIWAGVKKGLLGGQEGRVHRLAEARYWKERTSGPMTAAEVAAYEAVPLKERPFYKKVRREIEAEMLKKETKSILGESLNVVAETFSEAVKSIWKDMPAGMRKEAKEAWAKHLERIKELTKPAGRALAGAGEPGAPAVFSMAGDMVKNLVSGMAKKLAPLEARFLTFAPGTAFSYEQQTAKNTKASLSEQKTQNSLLKQLIRELQRSKQGIPQLATSNFR